jgi:hypothetical protein
MTQIDRQYDVSIDTLNQICRDDSELGTPTSNTSRLTTADD